MRTDVTRALEQEFPDWRIWLSRRGLCWAATLKQPTAGGDPTVVCDSAEELRLALLEQGERMRRRAKAHNLRDAWP